MNLSPWNTQEAGEAPVSQQEAWTRFSRGARPDWVEPVEAPLDGPADGPVAWLLYDEQYRLAPELERYTRMVRRADTDLGVGWLSEIRIQFNPSFERLTLHCADILRDGERIDGLADADLDFLRVEEDMHARVYRGDYVLLAQLRMLEPGDALELAYTISGQNPVYGGRLDLPVSLSFTVPLAHQFCRVVRPRSSSATVRTRGPAVALIETVHEGEVELRLDRRDVERAEHEADVPAEHDDQHAIIHFSGFADWGDVARWGSALYRLEPNPAVEALLESFHAQRDVDPALAAIAYVQERIRYVATCFGEGGYRPRDPAIICKRRYGDCKDKALLLAILLRRLGHEADVALINSGRPLAPLRAFPGPGAFDHVVVRAVIDGEVRWIDATATGQRGPLGLRGRPHSAAVLVLRGDTVGLEILPPPHEGFCGHFSDGVMDLSAGPGGPATISYTNVAIGSDAEEMRRWLAAAGHAGVERAFRDMMSEEFGIAEEESAFEIEDDIEANSFIVRNRLIFPDPWHVAPDGRREFRATICHATTLLPVLASHRRTLPLSLHTHPMHHRHREVLMLPEGQAPPAGAIAGTLRRANAGFTFTRQAELRDGAYDVTVETRTLAASLPAEEVRGAYADEAALQHAHKLHLIFDAPESPAGNDPSP
ncbi:MAG TPA: DUF3857 domain-containing protein [Allosphingosinicella sp.]